MDLIGLLQDQVAKYRLLGSRIRADMEALSSLVRKLGGLEMEKTDQLEVAFNVALSRWTTAWDQLQFILGQVQGGVDINTGWSLAAQASSVALEMEGITAMVAGTEKQMSDLAAQHGVSVATGSTSKLVLLVGYALMGFALYGVAKSRGGRRY